MSIDHSLELAAEVPPARILQLFAAVPGFRTSSSAAVAPGLHVTAAKPGRLTVATITDEFGFVPNTTVSFHWAGVDDPIETRKHLVRGCLAVLTVTSGDAVLLLNGEVVAFVRRAGEWIVNLLPDFWSPEVIALLPTAHRAERMKSI